MRELGNLPDLKAAQALAGYLQTRAIETRLDSTPQGVVIWVCDEDKVALARQEYQQFLQHPEDERYRNAPRPPPEEKPLRHPAASARPASPEIQVTLSLIVLSVLATLMFASAPQQQLAAEYLFRLPVKAEGQGLRWLPEPPFTVHEGQLWRLVTPIFVHLSVWHLVFNMFALFHFASQIERRSGSLRLLLLVLLLALLSNECQYLFRDLPVLALLERLNPANWFSGEALTPLDFRPNPAFGGISGVVYGLFGYVWMRAVYDRSSELHISGTTILILMAWLFLCMTGEVGPIGNIAHVVGLIVGLFAGYLSAWWNRFGYREG